MNNKFRELELLRDLSVKLKHPDQKDWLFPLQPKEYQIFSRKRNSKYCVGEHSLFLVEYVDVEEDEALVFEKEDVEGMKKFLDEVDTCKASMQIHEIVVHNENEVSMDVQTYGASFDCDHVYPLFKYNEALGLWICYDPDNYPLPVILDFSHAL